MCGEAGNMSHIYILGMPHRTTPQVGSHGEAWYKCRFSGPGSAALSAINVLHGKKLQQEQCNYLIYFKSVREIPQNRGLKRTHLK